MVPGGHFGWLTRGVTIKRTKKGSGAMSLIRTSHESASRRQVILAFTSQGVIGLLLLTVCTYLRVDETAEIMARLGPTFFLLIAIFFSFSVTLALLKFSLAEMVFVSFLITAYSVMIPLLGLVASAWIGVFAAIFARTLGILQLGPVKSDPDERVVDWIKAFGQFGTYGIPIVAASLVYTAFGGQPPIVEISGASVWRIVACGLTLQITNNIVMSQMVRAYGYTFRKHLLLSLIDTGIYAITLPFCVLVVLSYPSLGWRAIVGWSFIGVMGNWVGRNLALTRSASRTLVSRLSSLANLGRTIALNVGTDELLMAVYESCKSAVDVSFFSIALLDESQNELSFELDIHNGERLPKTRVPLGQGLTSWVVLNHEHLLIRSSAEEKRFGLEAFDDGMRTESWLGVPLIARDQMIGAISVQSYAKNRFSQDDVVLLTSIANQAAVALSNAMLYRDLQGLTVALEQRVAERTSELRETNVRLVAADRSKSQFLANMSHELRTPLNSIIGFSAVLLRSTQANLEARMYRFIENIHTAGNHLLTLINDILDLSKIEAGRLQMHFDQFDLSDTIVGVERVMRGVASEAHIHIVTSIAPDVGQVCLDEGRVKQILFNLLSNAVKFSRPRATVQLIAKRLPASQSPLGKESIVLLIRDDGIGIASGEMPRIFDPFHQTEEGRKFSKHGTGLGLSLTRSFTELLGGHITVDSTLGNGSTFTVLLPVDGRELSPAERRPLPAEV